MFENPAYFACDILYSRAFGRAESLLDGDARPGPARYGCFHLIKDVTKTGQPAPAGTGGKMSEHFIFSPAAKVVSEVSSDRHDLGVRFTN